MRYYLSLFWKILLCVTELIGLYMGSGLAAGAIRRRFPYMFTNLSNIAVLIYFLLAVIWMLSHKGVTDIVFAPTAKHMVTMAVTVTFLISHFFLFDNMFDGGYLHVELLILHYIAPIMAILDWLFFDEKGFMKKWEPLVWVVGPLGYLAVALVSIAVFGSRFGAAEGQSPYPYAFIDLDRSGVGGVAKFVVITAIAFIVLGYIFYGIDHMAAGLQRGSKA